MAPQVATLGVGTFSRVKLVKHRGTGKTYALKIMRQKKIEQVRASYYICSPIQLPIQTSI